MAIERIGKYGIYIGNTYNTSEPLTYEQMKTNAKYIYKYLNDKGWTLNAICGMLGNMESESTINSGRWQSDIIGGDPTLQGYSLVQWTPYTKYTEWATSNGYADPSEMDTALDRIIYEVENNIQWIATESFNFSFEEFTKSNDTPYNLAMSFLANYERPAEPNQPSRGTQADAWYDFLSNELPIPIITLKKKKFKWSIYINKINERRNF